MSMSKQMLYGLIAGGITLGAMFLFPEYKTMIKKYAIPVWMGLYFAFFHNDRLW